MESKNYERAEYYLLEAEKLIEPQTPYNLEMMKIYSRFYELYLGVRDFEKALAYQSKYITLKDSIYNEELTNNLMEIEARFLERENTAKIASQKEIIVLKEEIINYQKTLNIITGLLTLISGLLLVFLFRNYKKNKSLNVLLDRKVQERTKELETNRNDLLNRVKSQKLILRRASSGAIDRINTIKGLCFTARQEVSDSLSHYYLKKIYDTSWQLDRDIGSLFDEDSLTKNAEGLKR